MGHWDFTAHEVQGGNVNKISSFSSSCAWHFEENCINNYLNRVPMHIFLCNAKLEPTCNIEGLGT